MMDGLIGRMDPLPIFFVNGLRTIFLKSIDTSKFAKKWWKCCQSSNG